MRLRAYPFMRRYAYAHRLIYCLLIFLEDLGDR